MSNFPMCPLPEQLNDVLNISSEQLVAIDDLDLLLAIQHKLSQFRLHTGQRLGQVKRELCTLEDEFTNKISISMERITPKSLTVAEKRARVLAWDESLQELNGKVVALKAEKQDLESWVDSVDNLIEAVKQAYYLQRSRNYRED